MWPETGRALPQMLPIHSDKDVELWVPYLEKNSSMGVMIGWPDTGLDIQAVTVNVTSAQYTEHRRWEERGLKFYKQNAQKYSLPYHAPTFRMLRLEQICEQFFPIEIPRKYLTSERVDASLPRKTVQISTKGTIMKWWWMLLVIVLIPVLAQAEARIPKKTIEIVDISTIPLHTYILDGTIKPNAESDRVRVAKFAILPMRDSPSIRMHIRLFFDKGLMPWDYPKGRCYLKIKGDGVFHVPDYFFYTTHGPEVWLPHLIDRQRTEIFIVWEPDAPVLQYARSMASAETFHKMRTWMPQAIWDAMRRIEVKDFPEQFLELRLDDVCLASAREEDFPFSEQDLKTFQY